jgi:hypothetical protein
MKRRNFLKGLSVLPLILTQTNHGFEFESQPLTDFPWPESESYAAQMGRNAAKTMGNTAFKVMKES